MNKKGETETVKKNKHGFIQSLLLLCLTSAVLIIALGRFGIVGTVLANTMNFLCGPSFPLLLIILIFFSLHQLWLDKLFTLHLTTKLGLIFFYLALILTAAYLTNGNNSGFTALEDFLKDFSMKIFVTTTPINYGGGLCGITLYALISALLDQSGTMVTIIILFLVALLLSIPFASYRPYFGTLADFDTVKAKFKERKALKAAAKEAKRLKEKTAAVKEETLSPTDLKNESEQNTNSRNSSIFINYVAPDKQDKSAEAINLPLNKNKNVKNLTAYRFPPLNVFEKQLHNKSSNINKTSAAVKGAKVIEILNNFGIEAELLNTHIGPSVTKFEIRPDSSVKVQKIQAIQDNIKMELAAKDIRIESPIPGRSAVGVEIPNVEPIPVRMYELLAGLNEKELKKPLNFILGKDLLGKTICCELNKMPHLLIAGATGSGKSVCINALISCLLYHVHPQDVKLVLVDPKKVEFTPYHDIPHLLWPVITEADVAANMLKRIVVIMEGRFELFSECAVRNIDSYNEFALQKGEKKLPYIIVIIDELADLMMVAGKEVEASIQRITQLARAAGIHLVVATQRPSTDVITGIIKSNIPSRISFSVASGIDSRTILDQSGAERLLGNGDMLYFPQGESSPLRLQGVYVTDKEVRNITDFVKKQAGPDYEDSYFAIINAAKTNTNSEVERSLKDSLYDEAREFVINAQKASTSLLQRQFGIGYNRAAGLIAALEDQKIIGPANGSKPREVYIKREKKEE